jgi:chorismate dehydratase
VSRKIRVGAVSYLNTKPLIYGLQKGLMAQEAALILDYPSNIAQKLLNNEIDIGLVPVAILPQMPKYYIVSDYAICCDGPVASVCLFSDVPVQNIREVLLDYQSRTSVRLAGILLKEFWKTDPVMTDTQTDFSKNIKGDVAGVVIGDRALELRSNYKYVYDLGEAWKSFTGLPFVFAAWVSNKVIDPSFIDQFNAANAFGLNRLEEVIAENPVAFYDLKEYYRKNIVYKLNEYTKPGMDAYLTLLQNGD